MKTYTLEEIKEALRKEFTWSEDCMGIEIVKKPEDGDWFEKLYKDVIRHLK